MLNLSQVTIEQLLLSALFALLVGILTNLVTHWFAIARDKRREKQHKRDHDR